MGVRRVHVVIMIGRWSEGSVWTVRHVVFCSTVGEQKVMSREDVWQCLGRILSFWIGKPMSNMRLSD